MLTHHLQYPISSHAATWTAVMDCQGQRRDTALAARGEVRATATYVTSCHVPRVQCQRHRHRRHPSHHRGACNSVRRLCARLPQAHACVSVWLRCIEMKDTGSSQALLGRGLGSNGQCQEQRGERDADVLAGGLGQIIYKGAVRGKQRCSGPCNGVWVDDVIMT